MMNGPIKLHNSIDAAAAAMPGAVIAIGNFDGLHLGHQALIGRMLDIAGAAKAPGAVMTFEPHPREFFDPGGAPFRLTLLPMKARLLSQWRAPHLAALPFDASLAALSGEAFINEILVGRLKARHIVVGHDFVFGKNRSGGIVTLQAAAAAGKFGLTVVDPVAGRDGAVYSSTKIRTLLSQGDFDGAEKLLGWRWQMEAPVVHGDKRGRALGYPTANQQAGRYIRLPYGIYAVDVSIEEGAFRRGVANFGIRPMFRIEQPIFETFIFDFSQDIYGKNMRVRPLRYLRPEAAFDGLEALKNQMKQDCVAARSVVISS